jgi:hypothetical protein
MNSFKGTLVSLGGIAVTCLPTNPRFEGSNPARDNGILNAIKIRGTTSFGGEVTPSVPCHKILWHVKEHYENEERYFVGKIQHFPSP